MFYPRKVKAKKKQASPNFKPVGNSIEERPASINKRENVDDFEIDTVIQTREKKCRLTLGDRKNRYQIIRLADILTLRIFIMHTPIRFRRGERMRTTTDLLGVGYLKEVKKRRNNKSHLLNTGVKTIPKSACLSIS